MDFTAQKHLLQSNPDLPKKVVEELLGILEQAQFAQAQASAALERERVTQATLARAENRVKEVEFQNEKLAFELAYLRRMRYGAKSESWSPEQRDLFEETIAADIAAIEAEMEKRKAQALPAIDDQKKEPRARGRQPLPAHLPRVDIHHEVASCTCGECGKALVAIGEDVTEKLTVKPAVFSVERHHYPKYACRCCETVVAAPVPAAIIDGGSVTIELLVWLVVSKFVDHLPLYRLEKIGDRHGVPLPRSNLAAWIGKIGIALEPLARRLAELLRERSCLHADETTVAQLEPKSGKTKRAYLWVYRSNDLDGGPPIVVFDYQTGRSGSHARAFLEGWQGHLCVDGYSGYQASFKGDTIQLACMAHARRKFFDLHAANQSPLAAEALLLMGQLYQIERDGADMDIAGRMQLRRDKSVPVLKTLHQWLTAKRAIVAKGGAVMNAIDYSLKRWPALERYAETGHLPIDNNPVENSLRPIALGRKNWQFVGSERAGERAAIIYSLLGTALLNDLEPSAWLLTTLEKLPTWPNSRLDELLPLRELKKAVA